jgi:hypothetical protein
LAHQARTGTRVSCAPRGIPLLASPFIPRAVMLRSPSGSTCQRKAPTSAQHFYHKERREHLRAEEPGLSSMDVTSRLADEWRQLDASERLPFVEMAKADKIRFELEKESGVSNPRSVKMASSPPLPLPKKPYDFFADGVKDTLSSSSPGLQIIDLPDLIEMEWAKLDEKARAPYVEQARQDAERYQRPSDAQAPSADAEATMLEETGGKEDGEEHEERGYGAEGDSAIHRGGGSGAKLAQENAKLKRKVHALEQSVEELEAKCKQQREALDKLQAAESRKATKQEREKEKEREREREKEREREREREKEKEKEKERKGSGSGSKRARPAKEKDSGSDDEPDDVHYETWCRKVCRELFASAPCASVSAAASPPPPRRSCFVFWCMHPPALCFCYCRCSARAARRWTMTWSRCLKRMGRRGSPSCLRSVTRLSTRGASGSEDRRNEASISI